MSQTQQTNSTGATEGQVCTFEDVPIYARCEYRGRKGWILEKGNHIREGTEGRHIRVQYDEGEELAGRSESSLHERIVNKNLRKDGTLWIDFGHHLVPKRVQ